MSRSLLTTSLVFCTLSLAQGQQKSYQRRQGEPLPGLTDAQLRLFDQGREAFAAPLTIAEGLGPIMNDQSCAALCKSCLDKWCGWDQAARETATGWKQDRR